MEPAYSLPYLSMGGDCLPEVQNIEMAVFAPSSCVDCCCLTGADGHQLGSADCTPAGTAFNAFFSGDWEAAVIRSERSCSPETSPLGFMVADPSQIWISSTAQSADTRVLAAAAPVAAAAPAPLPAAGERVVARSRAARASRAPAAKGQASSQSPADTKATQMLHPAPTGEACEQQPGSALLVAQQDADKEQPPAKRTRRAPSQRQASAAGAAAAGAPSTFSGVLQPFQAVRGYGLGNSVTLQQINARLKHAAQRTASPSL